MTKINFSLGPMAELKELEGLMSDDDLAHYRKDNEAICRSYIRGYIPESLVDKAFKKLSNSIIKTVQRKCK